MMTTRPSQMPIDKNLTPQKLLTQTASAENLLALTTTAEHLHVARVFSLQVHCVYPPV
ncbi:unannotated protein [freshwater metagenome]|uniref:Unannotated protein n=1 Tax=freshwater metagenome TaxID=449393 RepID=A0A6J7RR13_9ZZZZ